MGRILLIDDEDKLRSLLARIIRLEGFEVMEADGLKSAQKMFARETFDLFVCDVKLPDGNGLDLIKEIKEKQPWAEVILLTAYGNIQDGVHAIQLGAFDYIVKGDENSRIIPLVHSAYDKVKLALRVRQLEQQVSEMHSFNTILGKSKAILEVIALAKKVSLTDTSVLISGETGTGKEVFAHAIHHAGARRLKPFVALNCAAFSGDLMESELFGYVSGAFTGAVKNKKGLLEEAHTGTLFLDEIGEMAMSLQAKLLRALETKTFFKVGATVPTSVDVRIIAATNRNLVDQIEKGFFRSDLFYRLSVFQITLPPLRERIADIEILALKFAQEFSEKMNKKISGLDQEFVGILRQNQWKGNIRELKNIIERSVILTESETLDAGTLPYDIRNSSPTSEKLPSQFSLSSVEKLHIMKVLSFTQGNKAEAARLLGIGVATLYRKLEEYRIA